MDDERLLKAIARGDKHALALLYTRHKDSVFTATTWLLCGNSHMAEDIVHDVFITLTQSAAEVRIARSMKNYLITCCLNRARDRLRRESRQDPPPDFSTSASRGDGPSMTVLKQEEASRVVAAVSQLPLEQREVVALRIQGNLKFREIADYLAISINTAQSRYRYALDSLRKQLSEPSEV